MSYYKSDVLMNWRGLDIIQKMLKLTMTHAPVLALPNFNEYFMFELDASGLEMSMVLPQNNNPVCFSSK